MALDVEAGQRFDQQLHGLLRSLGGRAVVLFRGLEHVHGGELIFLFRGLHGLRQRFACGLVVVDEFLVRGPLGLRQGRLSLLVGGGLREGLEVVHSHILGILGPDHRRCGGLLSGLLPEDGHIIQGRGLNCGRLRFLRHAAQLRPPGRHLEQVLLGKLRGQVRHGLVGGQGPVSGEPEHVVHRLFRKGRTGGLGFLGQRTARGEEGKVLPILVMLFGFLRLRHEEGLVEGHLALFLGRGGRFRGLPDPDLAAGQRDVLKVPQLVRVHLRHRLLLVLHGLDEQALLLSGGHGVVFRGDLVVILVVSLGVQSLDGLHHLVFQQLWEGLEADAGDEQQAYHDPRDDCHRAQGPAADPFEEIAEQAADHAAAALLRRPHGGGGRPIEALYDELGDGDPLTGGVPHTDMACELHGRRHKHHQQHHDQHPAGGGHALAARDGEDAEEQQERRQPEGHHAYGPEEHLLERYAERRVRGSIEVQAQQDAQGDEHHAQHLRAHPLHDRGLLDGRLLLGPLFRSRQFGLGRLFSRLFCILLSAFRRGFLLLCQSVSLLVTRPSPHIISI